VPLAHSVCRDPKDDPFLECALAGGASIIVSRDRDLLGLEKPFGIQVLTPRQFLARLKKLEQAAGHRTPRHRR
jgi:predicted nucleic acid-binding protein